MKRTFERIVFMVIGALIAFFGYIFGSFTTEINAEPKIIDEITVRKLHIVDSQNRPVIIFHANDEATMLAMSKYSPIGERIGVIGLNIDDETSSITLFDGKIKSNTRLFKKADGRSGLSITDFSDGMPMIIGHHPASGGYVLVTTANGTPNGGIGDFPGLGGIFGK